MPYNNTPLPPPKEVAGQVTLPLARIKKIIHTDEDIASCSNNAAFVITIATEMFIQHLAEKSFEIVKAEKRGKKSLQYIDLANAVARLDNLEFLTDCIPRTTTYRKFVSERGRTFKPGSNPQTSIVEGPTDSTDVNGNGETVPSRQHLSMTELGVDEPIDNDVTMEEEEPRAPNEELMHDPVQEQLAMEMAGHGNGVNGTYG